MAISEFFRKLLWLFQRNRLDRELAEEMRLHGELKRRRNLAGGMSAADAHDAARRQFGNMTRYHEESRQSWGFAPLESVVQDLRYGVRGLRNAPAFTAVALLTLALGIGATTAIFSIVYALLVRPLPYHDSPRIVYLWTASSMFPDFRMGQSVPNLEDIKARAHSFERIASYQYTSMVLTGAGEPEQVHTLVATSNFLEVFNVHPILGRAFGPGDESLQSGNVVLLAHDFWQRRLGGNSSVVGKPIMLDQRSYTIVGVLPAGFAWPPSATRDEKIEALVPLTITPEQARNRSKWLFFTIAKLRRGAGLAQAQTEMDSIAASLSREHPKEAPDIHFPVVTISAAAAENGRRELLILLIAVSFLLLIACANVSNLILSRGVQRRPELALRAALGASRPRILRQLLLETFTLALVGGAAGLAFAIAGVRAFHAFAPKDFPRLAELRVEPAILLFAFLASTLAALVCGLFPALAGSRVDLNAAIKDRSRAVSAHGGRVSLRSVIVVTEVALALVLLTGSALMAQSLFRLLKVDPGLHTDHMVAAGVTLSATRYPSDESRQIFVKRLFDALKGQPQLRGVAMSNNSILEHSTALLSFEPSAIGLNDKQTLLEARSIAPGYFESLGIPLQRGRSFTERDVKGSREIAIVNQSLASRFFAGQDPVGRMIKFSADSKEQYQIVGVVADTRDINLGARPRPQIYFPLFQDAYTRVWLLVRSSMDAASVTALLQQCLWSVDKDEPLQNVRAMEEVISSSIAEPRFRTWLLTAFAVAGLGLTLIGIYGVISYSVAQRTHEMGIRIALGARPDGVLRIILGQGLRLALIGAVTGVVASILLMRLIASQLYDIKPGDPATLLGAAGMMLLVAIAASYIPGRRATRVDPVIALRQE
jgi:putative ABC transport system permease protein